MERPKEPSDMEIVLELSSHIMNPCSFTHEGRVYHIRDFYIDMARNLMPNLSNPGARDFLQTMVNSYSTQSSQ